MPDFPKNLDNPEGRQMTLFNENPVDSQVQRRYAAASSDEFVSPESLQEENQQEDVI